MKKTLMAFFAMTMLSLSLNAAPALPDAIMEALTDGNNSGTVSVGFYMGEPISGELLQLNAKYQRETDLYRASFGLDITDEYLAILLGGGVYCHPLESLSLGAEFACNPLFMYGIMAEQNLAAEAFLRAEPFSNMKVNLGLGILYKINDFFAISGSKGFVRNLTAVLDFSVAYSMYGFTLTAGVSSHTDYTYLLFLYPRWNFSVEYAMNDRMSAAIEADVQYSDMFLSGFVDSVSLEASCRYRF